MTIDELRASVNGYFQAMERARTHHIDDDTNFIESGLLDSLSLAGFILFVEERTKTEISISDFDVETISSVSKIYSNYVAS